MSLMASNETQAGHIKLEGRREPDAATVTTRMPAGWEPEPRGGRGPLAARPTFQVSLGPGGGSGAGLRESRSEGAGLGGASEWGRSRIHFLGSTCHPAGEPAPQEEVRDGSRTPFLRPD